MFKAYNHKAFNKSEKEKIDQYIDLALNFNKNSQPLCQEKINQKSLTKIF